MIQLCSFTGSDLFRANVRYCARWNIVRFSYNLTVACHICVQPMVNYISIIRTVGVVWVCRRFDCSDFCCLFGVAVLTIDPPTVKGNFDEFHKQWLMHLHT